MTSPRLLLAAALLLATGGALSAQGRPNLHWPYAPVFNLSSGMAWPAGQALPTFATPATVLDTILVQDLTPDEQITFSALQGLVNKTQPRIYLLDNGSDEGTYTWANTPQVNFPTRILYTSATKLNLISKYAARVSGFVLYDPVLSPHYRNLATTVAGLRNALPVTPEIRSALIARGINLNVLVDLTTLSYMTPGDIYNHLYATYWPECNKRVLVSANPEAGGDFHHTRDIAAATGGAVVWLSTTSSSQRAILGKFLDDMETGQAVVLGWYTTERSGITLATARGIGTIPADFYISGTVYGGTDHRIAAPKVPPKPVLANKVYVTIFISDGDNAQYMQRAMRKIWDQHASSRGKVPMNWTVAPGMVDLGPALLNYYYGTATPNDCFVAGPSGMGYIMPVNTYSQSGAASGNHLTSPSAMDAYARLTETYLQRAGLRALTVWDNANAMHRAAYERFGRNLYGATVQRFSGSSSVTASVENNRVRFDRLLQAYAETYTGLRDSLNAQINAWDGQAPLFLSTQVSIWGEMKPNRIVDLVNELNAQHPGKLVFVRADHYFNLFNEANGLPFNLAMSPLLTVTASAGSASPALAVDGTTATQWTSSAAGTRMLRFNFGRPFNLRRYVIRHAGSAGMNPALNVRDFRVQVSLDGVNWSTIDNQTSNEASVTDVEFPSVSAQFVRLIFDQSGADSTTRVADVELFGENPKEIIPPVPDPPFQAWMDDLPPAEKPPADQRGPDDQPARDGLSNLMKYALGLKPLTSSAHEAPRIVAPAPGTLGLELVRAKNAKVRLIVEGSTDLAAWQPVSFVERGHENVGADRERLRLEVASPDASAFYLRLRVEPES